MYQYCNTFVPTLAQAGDKTMAAIHYDIVRFGTSFGETDEVTRELLQLFH